MINLRYPIPKKYMKFYTKKKERIFLKRFSLCGKGGIRTPGTSQYVGFQDRCNRPLCHLSKTVENAFFSFGDAKVWRKYDVCKFLAEKMRNIFIFLLFLCLFFLLWCYATLCKVLYIMCFLLFCCMFLCAALFTGVVACCNCPQGCCLFRSRKQSAWY